MRIKLDAGAFAPVRAHDTDAGMDLKSRITKTVHAHSAETFDTGVHIEIPHGWCGVLISKSGLNTKFDITSTGLIDEGYTGSICVKLRNNGNTAYEVKTGEKISQLVLVPCLYANIEIVDEIEGGERGESGFGSTGRGVFE